MKHLLVLSSFIGLMFLNAASAADITVYYSPSCPHCHHARDFITNTLVYEYPELTTTMVNVMEPSNRAKFQQAVEKCGFESGGVPVLVIGEKCEQGYADFMQDKIREYVEIDLTDEQKAAASANRKALEKDAEKFKSDNPMRANAIVEFAEQATVEKKNNTGNSTIWFWGLLIALVAGLGYILVRKDNK
jgi:glutaredoxin